MTNTNTEWEDKIKEIVSLSRKQNWKNGGVHEYDSDEIEEPLAEVLRTEKEKSYQEGVEAEREKIGRLINSTANDIEKLELVVNYLNTPTNAV